MSLRQTTPPPAARPFLPILPDQGTPNAGCCRAPHCTRVSRITRHRTRVMPIALPNLAPVSRRARCAGRARRACGVDAGPGARPRLGRAQLSSLRCRSRSPSFVSGGRPVLRASCTIRGQRRDETVQAGTDARGRSPWLPGSPSGTTPRLPVKSALPGWPRSMLRTRAGLSCGGGAAVTASLPRRGTSGAPVGHEASPTATSTRGGVP